MNRTTLTLLTVILGVAGFGIWKSGWMKPPAPKAEPVAKTKPPSDSPAVLAAPKARVKTAPLKFPVPGDDLAAKLADLSPECRKLAVSAVKLNVQTLGFDLRYRTNPQAQQMPGDIAERFQATLGSGKCGTDLKDPKMKQAHDFLKKQCAMEAPTANNFDTRYNQMQGCLLGLRLWRSEVAAFAYRNVPLNQIQDPGVVAALLEGQFAGLSPLPTDHERAAELAKRFAELQPTSPQAAILRFQTAYLRTNSAAFAGDRQPAENGERAQKEFDESIEHLKKVDPDNLRVKELELDSLATKGQGADLEEAAARAKQENPDSFLGPYYTAYSLFLKGDKVGAKQELQRYSEIHPTSTLVSHTLSLMNGMPDAKAEQLFLNRNKALFLEQFDADESTGELPLGAWEAANR